jgi:hypothetical protein
MVMSYEQQAYIHVTVVNTVGSYNKMANICVSNHGEGIVFQVIRFF